jgi:hypothetical protein
VAASLASLLGISASRIKVVSVHAKRRLEGVEGVEGARDNEREGTNEGRRALGEVLAGKLAGVGGAAEEGVRVDAADGWTWTHPQHRRLQGTDVSLVFEILPETPTVALSVGSSTSNSTATRAATTATFTQQSAMADLGTQVMTLAVSGSMSSAIATATGFAVAQVQVVPPAVTVSLPPPVEVPAVVIAEGSPTPAPTAPSPTAAPTAPPAVTVVVAFQGLDVTVSEGGRGVQSEGVRVTSVLLVVCVIRVYVLETADRCES